MIFPFVKKFSVKIIAAKNNVDETSRRRLPGKHFVTLLRITTYMLEIQDRDE